MFSAEILLSFVNPFLIIWVGYPPPDKKFLENNTLFKQEFDDFKNLNIPYATFAKKVIETI